MAKNYLDLRLSEFLDAITDKRKVYQFTILETESTFEGTLPELYSALSKCNVETRQKLQPLLDNQEEYEVEIELNEIEIYNYLEKITSNFDEVKTKIILNDIEVYYSMDFMERIEFESSEKYRNNNWEIPLLKVKSPFSENNKEFRQVPDYEKMLQKTHPFSGFLISRVIRLLKQKLEPTQNEKDKKENILKTKNKNDFPEIFEDGGYNLFCLLNEEYTKDNKIKKTKFINIYHFLEYNEKLRCTQLEYIQFIKDEYNVTLSKITPETLKYKEKIKPLLHKYSKGLN